MNSTLQIVGDSKFGGATYLIISWCKYLVERGWDVSVLTTDKKTISVLSDISGITIITSVVIPREIKPLHDLKAFSQLVKLLKRLQFDVVHTYTATPGFLGRVAARVAGVPVVLHHQAGWTVTDFSTRAEKIIYTPLEYIAALASTRGICVSHAIRKEASVKHLAPSSKLVTICNGIDAEPFTASDNIVAAESLRKELGIPSGHIVVGSTGRLADQKDYQTFFHACRKFKDSLRHTDIAVVIAGDGPEREKLEELARTLDLQDSVYFLGFVTNIPSVLALMDIYVTTTLREGLSISILEAMAGAKPIIATSIGPNAELIEHEVTGLLIDPKSPDQLFKAIARFLDEPNLAQKCAAEAQKRVLQNYTLERMFRETMDLYLQFLSSAKSRQS
jgi:glycosyltransferase involved in cell wall biosynthesis